MFSSSCINCGVNWKNHILIGFLELIIRCDKLDNIPQIFYFKKIHKLISTNSWKLAPNKFELTSNSLSNVLTFLLNNSLIFGFDPWKRFANLSKNIFCICFKSTYFIIIQIISSSSAPSIRITTRDFHPVLFAIWTLFYKIKWIGHIIRIIWKQ